MSQTSLPADRTFSCEYCGGEIRIPYELPPTTAPCPLCGKDITSPPPPAPEPTPAGSLKEPLVPLTQVESASALHLDPLVDRPGGEQVPAATPAPAAPPTKASAAPATPAAVRAPTPAPTRAPTPAASPAATPRPSEVPVQEAAQTAAVAAASAPMTDLPGAAPDLEEVIPPELDSGFRNINPVLPFVAVIGLIVLLLVAALLLNRGKKTTTTTESTRSAVERSRFLREGWRNAATERLDAFLNATTPEERAKHVIGGPARVDDLRRFYGAGEISDQDTPLAAFSHFDLETLDKERGIFMMRYERPAQFDMREFFRPVAPLDIQYRLVEPGLLLSSFASLDNFAMEPVRVMAFFKKEGKELLLDWDVFAQTKHRTLRTFTAYPQPGQSQAFRVIINEDVPTTGAANPERIRYYRFSDPAHSADHVKLPVLVGSTTGRILEGLNWIGLPGRGMPSQTATVVLTWTEGEDSRIDLQEILCWEFLGLGGAEGNAVPGVKYNPDPESQEQKPDAKEAPADPAVGGA